MMGCGPSGYGQARRRGRWERAGVSPGEVQGLHGGAARRLAAAARGGTQEAELPRRQAVAQTPCELSAQHGPMGHHWQRRGVAKPIAVMRKKLRTRSFSQSRL